MSHPWADFLAARLRLIHYWAKEGIPGRVSNTPLDISNHLNTQDPGQIRLLLATPIEDAPPASVYAELVKAKAEIAQLQQDLVEIESLRQRQANPKTLWEQDVLDKIEDVTDDTWRFYKTLGELGKRGPVARLAVAVLAMRKDRAQPVPSSGDDGT